MPREAKRASAALSDAEQKARVLHSVQMSAAQRRRSLLVLGFLWFASGACSFGFQV
jgi:hypothetical protein